MTAAYRLAQRGLRVTLLEQSSTIGGNLVHAQGMAPFILGCHHATWSLLRALDSLPDQQLLHEPALELCLPHGRLVPYPRSRLPTPLHIASTIGRFAGLSWSERWKLLSWLEALWEGSQQLGADLEQRTAAEWLASLGQHDSLQRSIWNPISRWLTGNELQKLSADALVASLRPYFLQRASDTRIVMLEQSWQTLFVQPIVDFLNRQGSIVRLVSPVLQFQYEQERVTGVRTADGSVLQADWYLSALPHSRLLGLLPERWLSRYAYFQQIGDLATEPYTVVQIAARQALRNPRLVLLNHDSFHWVQAQPSQDNQCLFSLVMTGSTARTPEIEQQAHALLQSSNLLPASASIMAIQSSEIPQAFLSLPPGTKTRRPIQQSPIGNLFLAGAWTDTGWPANLESAIVSGERCTDLIAAKTATAH